MSQVLEREIVIVGAGPGGMLCALFLAKAGIACTLVDKARFPRDKICGDALSGKVVEVLKKLDPDFADSLAQEASLIGSWGVTFVAPNGKNLRIPFKKEVDMGRTAPGYVAKRLDFDAVLYRKVAAEPLIELIEGVKLSRFERKDHGIYSSDAKNETVIKSKLVAGGDGAYSAVAKQLCAWTVPPEQKAFGLRAYYTNVSGLDHQNFVELHFLKEALPGYFWIFPLPGNRANVGIGMRSDVISQKKIKLPKLFEHVLSQNEAIKSRFENAKLEEKIDLFPLPMGMEQRSISGDNYLLLGDAASLIDPFTGEGIGNAMMSGMLAAQTIQAALKTDDFSAQSLLAYDQAVYTRLWSELKLSKRMQQLVKYPWLFDLVVNKASTNPTLRETISCMFEDMDLREKLKQPSFYFKLLFSRSNSIT